MRLLIYARAQEAVPLYMTLKLDRADPVSLLMGGMSERLVREQIDKFESSPAAIMIATAAMAHGWRSEVEAMVMFSENSFVQSKVRAANRVLEPRIPVPTVDDLLRLMNRQAELQTYTEPDALLSYESVPDAEATDYAPDEAPLSEHTHVRMETDEYVCRDCGKRWGVDEDAPPCRD